MEDFEYDFLIVGTGIAALRAAIELDGRGQVLMLTKGQAEQGSTVHAQGGIAAAVAADDSPDIHASDTLAAGDGLCRVDAVRMLTERGPQYVQELIDWGAAFERNANGELALAREGAHSVRRVLHAQDATGKEICRVLWKKISKSPHIRILEQALVVDVIVDENCCVGVRFLDSRGQLATVVATATLLASGGAGQVFSQTTNPLVTAGDGIAIAYRAGAKVSDLEFVQFHPTVLDISGVPRFLLSEALRGEGAVLVNAAGERFMRRVDPEGDLAPRDRVARAIAREAQSSGECVYLTLEDLQPAFVNKRFPIIREVCHRAGLDLARDRIPVGPAAHYIMGGVDVDLQGQTSVCGLFAAGEVACSGVHGANRLASNSLLEGLVFGAVTGNTMRHWASGRERPSARRNGIETALSFDGTSQIPLEGTVRDLMWRDVGLFRDDAGLTRALGKLDSWVEEINPASCDATAARIASIVTVGQLIARAALRREESRGAHFRSDFPERNDIDWMRHINESKGGVTEIDVGEKGHIRN